MTTHKKTPYRERVWDEVCIVCLKPFVSPVRGRVICSNECRETYQPSSKHGSRGRYINHHCRCKACVQANTDYSRAYIEKRKAQHPDWGANHSRTLRRKLQRRTQP